MKIALVLVYFGSWPAWFPAFLLSCKYNRTIDWIIFTDCDAPGCRADNVVFVPFSMDKFSRLATDKLGFPVKHTNPYKLCDFKPTYGLVFEDYLADYDFWGHCDLDVVWGDIRKFITDGILAGHDVVSARMEKMCGHFSLYKNTQHTNRIFTLHRQYIEALTLPETVSFDEDFMTLVVSAVMRQGFIKAYWPGYVLDNEFVQVLRVFRSGWHWEYGKLYNLNDNNREIMYLHFSEWKPSLKHIDFSYQDSPRAFDISSERICAQPLPTDGS
jgi:hypothetical protein